MHKILFDQKLPFGQIKLTVDSDYFAYPDELQNQIDALWKEKVDESEKKGSKLWDGNNYRLRDYQYVGTTLHIGMNLVKYRNIWSMKHFLWAIERMSPNNRWNGLFVAWFIETSDNFFIIGEKSGRYLQTAWTLNFIGGVLQPDDGELRSIEDAYNWFLQEIKEEAWVDTSSVTRWDFLWMIQTEELNVWFVFYCKLQITKDAAYASYQENNDLEMQDLHFIPKNELADFLENRGHHPMRHKLEPYARLVKNI